MNYSQFLNMIPEATLMVVLLITFFADFCSSKSADRKWFNPLVCLLMVAHIAINIFPTEATSPLVECTPLVLPLVSSRPSWRLVH